MSKVIGILGGMGPLATADLFKKIIENTPAVIEQEHLRIIVYNNPKIPSRIEAILKGKSSPLPEMKKSALVLENAGADFIIIPCHTAHNWITELRETVKIPIYSFIEITTSFIKENYPLLSDKIMLLASEATVKQKLYQNAFGNLDFIIRIPSPDHQKIISSAVNEVKAGRLESNPWQERLNAVINHYRTSGFSAVLGGCTEIPLLFPHLDSKIEKLDATMIMARKAVALAK